MLLEDPSANEVTGFAGRLRPCCISCDIRPDSWSSVGIRSRRYSPILLCCGPRSRDHLTIYRWVQRFTRRPRGRRLFHRALTTLNVTPAEVVTDAAPVRPGPPEALIASARHHLTSSRPITMDLNTGWDQCDGHATRFGDGHLDGRAMLIDPAGFVGPSRR